MLMKSGQKLKLKGQPMRNDVERMKDERTSTKDKENSQRKTKLLPRMNKKFLLIEGIQNKSSKEVASKGVRKNSTLSLMH